MERSAAVAHAASQRAKAPPGRGSTRLRGAGPADARTREADPGAPEEFLQAVVRGRIEAGRGGGPVETMDEINTLVARLVLPATITTVLVLVVVNVAKDRERPSREAVRTAQSFVATAAVWLALALAVLFGVLESIYRWGLWVTLALNAGPPLAGGAVWAVVSIRRRRASRTALGQRHPHATPRVSPGICRRRSDPPPPVTVGGSPLGSAGVVGGLVYVGPSGSWYAPR